MPKGKKAGSNLAFPDDGGAPNTLRTGKDMASENAGQSGPNRGTNTGSASPGGVNGSTKAGARKRGGTVGSSAGGRKGAVTIQGSKPGAQTISGTAIAGVAQKGG